MKQLNESLKYLDMEHQVDTTLEIDKYKSSTGDDADIITLSFLVKSEQVGDDLSEWLEKGYDWVIDSETSPGEIANGKYIVFAEINRRTNAGKRIIEMLSDLDTLTGVKAEDWTLSIDGERYPATVDNIVKHVELNSIKYSQGKNLDLNEMREIAGLPTVKTYTEQDEELLAWKRRAGIR